MTSIYLAILLGLAAIVVLIVLYRQWNQNKSLAQLRSDWGKLPSDPTPIKDARLHFDQVRSEPVDKAYQVDDETWTDLNMDEIYQVLNRTNTPVGGQMLYHLLRHPSEDKPVLQTRERLIEKLQSQPELREQIQLALKRLNRLGVKYLSPLLWSPLPKASAVATYAIALSLIGQTAILLALFSVIHFGWLIPIFVINTVFRINIKRTIEGQFQTFEHLANLIRTSRSISKLGDDEIAPYQASLKQNCRNIGHIENLVFAMRYDDQLNLMEYVNSYFLWDVVGFYVSLSSVKRHLEQLKTLFKTVGELDSLIAVASFRKQFTNYCQPVFVSQTDQFRMDQAYNPLVQNPVTNSFSFEKHNYMVTGSNMAGKTTFIKTIGVNAVLAQTIHTCPASSYEGPLIRVISSISPEDSLIDGKSYFMAEVESVLRLITASQSGLIHLLILDEIFRGTNSVERHAISIETLNYLVNDKDFVLVASHDMQLAESLADRYQNIHFEERVDERGLTFDYLLRPGPSVTRNAIALIKQVGYPDKITDAASRRVEQ